MLALGRTMRNVVPTPSFDVRSIVLERSLTMNLQIDDPRPHAIVVG